MEKKYPAPMIPYSGRLPLGLQIAIANANIVLGRILPLWFTRAFTFHPKYRIYCREQDARIERAFHRKDD